MKIVYAIKRGLSIFRAAYGQLWQVRFLVWSAVLIAFSLITMGTIFKSQVTTFAFSKRQCVSGLIILPANQTAYTNVQSAVRYEKVTTIAGFPIAAKSVCYDFQSAPSNNKEVRIRHSLFGISLLSKNMVLNVGDYPKLNMVNPPATISTAKPFEFALTAPDNFFGYTLKTKGVVVPCQAVKAIISCEVKKLGLEPSKKYDFEIERLFNEKVVGSIATIQAQTANPVVLTSESIPNGSTVYDKPSQLVISADRALQSVDLVTMSATIGAEPARPVAFTSKQDGQKIVITWAEPLPRQADISLTIASANAPDGGDLFSPFTTTFKTSGGPKVVGVNIRDRAVPTSQRVVLTLDQELQPGQNLAALYGVKVGGVVKPATVMVSGRTVTIVPNTEFAGCTQFQVWAADGALNTSGISGGSAWQFNSRTTCATVFSIGTSLKGRSIVAYKFGSGPNTILFSGNLHGNETNTKRLLDAWINELEGNPGRIPEGKTIVVVPLTNPDGYYANTRTNANNVDLNRNFAANNWKSSVKMPSGEVLPTGGGVTALSEPESQALANYVSSISPKLVLSYHSRGDVVVANDAGNSWSLTQTYSSKSGYGAENGSSIGNFFDYDTTGAFEDWLHDKKGIAAILIELATRESDEFSYNKNAMWQMVFDY